MRSVLAVTTVVMSASVAVADKWLTPTEKEYFCESQRFVAHVTLGQGFGKVAPVLEVFEVKGGQRVSRCKPL
jgi:hypothetical protein